MNPLVSIITPSYNQGKYIEETINSVINQDYTNIEYIIIDGGSSDNTVDVIKKYGSKLAYWVSEPDKGQADAINKGFLKANGDYICWINSDDVLYPDFISRRIKEFELNPDVDMIYGDVDQGDKWSNRVIRKGWQTDYRSIVKNCYIPTNQQSAIWKKEVLSKVGILDPRWQVLLDFDFFLRITKDCSIKYFPGSVAFFRNHSDSKSIALKEKWIEELEVFLVDPVLKIYIDDPDLLGEFKFSANKWLYAISSEIGRRDLKQRYFMFLLRQKFMKWLWNYSIIQVMKPGVKLKYLFKESNNNDHNKT
jgi:glycosyltransferase involved in cell wall biosynthesis